MKFRYHKHIIFIDEQKQTISSHKQNKNKTSHTAYHLINWILNQVCCYKPRRTFKKRI